MQTMPMVSSSSGLAAGGVSEAVAGFVARSRSDQTMRAYRSDLEAFSQWCAGRSRSPLPATPETIAEWLADMAGTYTAATISRRMAGVSVAHQLAGYESPTRSPLVRRTLEGVRRTLGTAPAQHTPAGISEVRRMVAHLDTRTLAGARDAALLLVGFAIAARRSELVALTVSDLEAHPQGLLVHIRRSKTDQQGQGAVRALPYGSDPETCPVRALEHWQTLAGISSGPLFRSVDRWGRCGTGALSGAAVALIVKQSAERAGLDPAAFSGHSLRAGFCTTAAARGASDRAISHQTGHAPNSRVVRSYIRHASVFTDNAATGLGL